METPGNKKKFYVKTLNAIGAASIEKVRVCRRCWFPEEVAREP